MCDVRSMLSGNLLAVCPLGNSVTIRNLKRDLARVLQIPRFRQKVFLSQSDTEDVADDVLFFGSEIYLAVLSLQAFSESTNEAMLAAIESSDCQQLEEMLKLPHMPKFDVRRNNVSLSALIAKEMDMQLELLLEAYIDVEARDENHMTMLHCAALEDKPRALQMILTAGAQVDAVVRGDGVPWTEDVCGATALLIGAWKNHDVVVRLLLDARADLDQKDFRGETSLYKAVWQFGIKTLKALLFCWKDKLM
eukprot:s2112_g7.t1